MKNKKKIIVTMMAALLSCSASFAQTCNMALKDGSKLTVNITTFTNPLSTDKKFIGAKDEQKATQIAAYNADVLSGKVTAASNYDMSFNLKKTTLKNADEYAIGYTYAGVDYFSYVVCKNDTIYSMRNKGPVSIGTKENPIGYSIQGTQVIPMNMKAGDVLPTFEDISFMFPTTADVTLKKSVFDGYINEHSSYWGYGTDSKTGESGIGNFDVTTPRAVFKMIDVKAKQTVNVSAHSIQGVNATVTGVEEVSVNGVKYTAFIVESESWTKSNLTTSYQSADEELNKAQVEADKKLDMKMSNFMMKKQFTNKLGYMVMYSKQWIVPQLGGAVKTVSYDIYGGISTVMTTTKLE